MSKVQGVCVCALGHTVEWCRVVRYGVQFVEWWAAQEPSPAPTEPENVLQYATFWVRPDARLIDMLVTLVAAEHHVLAAAGPRVPGPAVDRETTDLSGLSRLHRGDSSFEQGPRHLTSRRRGRPRLVLVADAGAGSGRRTDRAESGRPAESRAPRAVRRHDGLR